MLRVTAVVGLLAGCGVPSAPVSFAGTYAGHVTVGGPCSDGSQFSDGNEWPKGNGAGTAQWVITETGNALSIDLGTTEFAAVVEGGCGPLPGGVVDDVTARLGALDCPPLTSNGSTTTTTFTGGTIKFVPSGLLVEIDSTVRTSGAVAGSCQVIEKGTLAKN